MEATPHATPAHLRQLELQQEELLYKASKIQGLFQFLNFTDSVAFDRCLGRSGKSPECLSRAPDGGPTARKLVAITTAGQNRKMRQQEASRAVQINAQRREPAALSAEETMARLKDVFTAYTDPMLYARSGRREMNIVGFLRLMRDCRLLDNRFTLVTADVIFTRVDAGVDVDGSAGGTVLGDLHVDFGEFIRCLRGVVRAKLPRQPDEQEGLLLLARKWVLPFAADSGVGGLAASVDGLFSRSTMNLIRKYDGQLKRLFAWYSSMEETDPSRVSWSYVRDHGCTISSTGFVLMLLNFDVLPVLLSKSKALDVFDRCEAANDGDECANRMFYPAFLETISEIALEVGKFVLPRIRAAASPDEFKLLRRYAEACPPPHGPKVMQVYQEVLVSRGRDASTLDQHYSYDAEGVRRQNEQKAAAALQRQLEAQATGVVQRREGMRQRFALTRLRNFYRDVRTTNNNTTWPPERDTSPQNRVSAGAHNGETLDGEGVHVAFYDAERAIKTPKPVWIPVGHAPGRRFNSNSTVPELLPTPTGAASAAAAASTGTMFGGGAGNLLLLETPTAAAGGGGSHGGGGHGGKPSAFLTPTGGGGGGGHKPPVLHIPGFSPSSPGAYVRSPKPYQLKVAIEDRDEHEAIMDLAGRLPYIRTPRREATDPQMELPTGVEPPAALLQALAGQPRAVTAPADLRQQWQPPPADGGTLEPPPVRHRAAGTRAAHASYDGGGAGLLAAEASRLAASPSRPHLPPVHHQPHRLQATAAAMAAMAGQQPQQPQAHPQLHLPPAQMQHGYLYDPLLQLGASPSSASLASIVPLGPSPSQLSALGIIPAPALSDSQRTRGSLQGRHRQGQRRRTDARGLPHLQLPVERAPGVEVEAALKELDKFDSSMMPVAVA